MGNGKFEGYLLVADFDDTFCPEHGAPVPEENRRAAQHFMDEGGLFTIATGRDVRSYYSIRDKFTVNAPLVLSNGAVIFDGESGESWYESFLPFSCRSDLLAARDAFPGTGMEVHRGADVRVCGSNATLEKHLSRMGVPVSEADPGHILYPWTKVVLVAPDEIRAESETAHALCAWIAAQFPGRYEAVPSGALVDVVAAGSDKGSGVRRIIWQTVWNSCWSFWIFFRKTSSASATAGTIFRCCARQAAPSRRKRRCRRFWRFPA